MKNFELITTQQPGCVTFDNYETIKENLVRYVAESFENADYSIFVYEATIKEYSMKKYLKGHA